MAKNKTTETEQSVSAFIQTSAAEKADDCFRLSDIMKDASGYEPKMWGPAIVGFGNYHYKYDSGREGDAPLVAFSPRKGAISLYLSSGFERREELLEKFGKHTSAKSCIYIKKLSDIDLDVLKEMVKLATIYRKNSHPSEH
jgi:hypothetical protein